MSFLIASSFYFVILTYCVILVVSQRYQSDSKIERVDGLAMVKDMGEEMENMMGDKIEAIKVRINSISFH